MHRYLAGRRDQDVVRSQEISRAAGVGGDDATARDLCLVSGQVKALSAARGNIDVALTVDVRDDLGAREPAAIDNDGALPVIGVPTLFGDPFELEFLANDVFGLGESRVEPPGAGFQPELGFVGLESTKERAHQILWCFAWRPIPHPVKDSS